MNNGTEVIASVSVLIALLGLIVLFKNPKSGVNRLFSLFCFLIAIWISTTTFLPIYQYKILARLSFASASLIPYILCEFANLFPQRLFTIRRITHVVLGVPPITLLVASFFDLLVQDYTFSSSATKFVYGPMFNPFIVYFLIYSSISFYILFRKLIKSKGIERNQISMLTYGILVSMALGLTTNIFLPTFGVNSLITLGPAFSIIMVITTSYAIIKHRMMDIGLAVIRSLSFIIMMLALIGVLAGSTFLMSLFVVGGLFEPWQSAIITFIVALIFWPLRTWITKATDKIFYKRTYDPQELMDAVSKKISSTLVLKEILNGVNELLSTYMKLSSCAFILFDENGDIIKEEKYKWADLDSSGLYYLANKGVLIRDDIEGNTDEKNILEKNGISVFQPVYNGKKLVGIFLAGEKKSGNLFSNQDVGIFSITAQSITVAIENARSYEQIQEFNVTLRHKIAEATQELRVKNAMLKKLDKAKDEFVSMASHQLRTPLTSVKGYLSMVVEGDAGKVTKQQKELLDEAYSSNERMVSLVNDFLNVSRIQTGKFMLEKVPVDLPKLVGEEVNNLVPNATKRQITLEYNPPTDVPELNIDEGKIRQVVMNYIDNAIYYSNPDSTIKIGLAVDGDDVVLTVKDTGIGVPVSEQAGLFTKFYRASNAKKQRPDGTGVGLYLAKKIITAHDGKIVFSTIEGKGSTFGFRLPIKELKLSADKEIENLKD